MKYFLIFILAIILYSCTAQKKPYSIQATVTKVEKEGSGYWITFRSGYKFFKTWQVSVPDSVRAGRVLELPVIYRVK